MIYRYKLFKFRINEGGLSWGAFDVALAYTKGAIAKDVTIIAIHHGKKECNSPISGDKPGHHESDRAASATKVISYPDSVSYRKSLAEASKSPCGGL